MSTTQSLITTISIKSNIENTYNIRHMLSCHNPHYHPYLYLLKPCFHNTPLNTIANIVNKNYHPYDLRTSEKLAHPAQRKVRSVTFAYILIFRLGNLIKNETTVENYNYRQ